MAIYVCIHTVLGRHPKMRDLARVLCEPIVHVKGYLVSLWSAALEMREDGDLSAWSPAFVAQAAEYEGEIDFLAALQKTGWLDGKVIHDWVDYAGPYLRARYHQHNRERLVIIWKKHGRVYGEPERRVKVPEGPEAQEGPESPSQGKPGAAKAILEAWNAWAEVHDLPLATKMTAELVRHLKARGWDLAAFRAILKQAEGQDFLFGKGAEGWKLDLDALLKSDKIATKIAEGRYKVFGGKLGGHAEVETEARKAQAKEESAAW